MRSKLERLDNETLLGLLQMYETALAELRATGDQHVAGLMFRFERHRAEVIVILAAQSADVAYTAPRPRARSQATGHANGPRRAANS